ncbi:Gfo/Idh/MocA family oxidoreductase [Terriglobus tenax]|uniref:oxidoreductase n=1 Tax=Terriglobus tenax TaxID=1111115 RepID=UPI0021E05F3B|nr:oxidoreductase [Terriglobus tenax]
MIRRLLVALLTGASVCGGAQDLRLGIVGTDSTHAVEFTRTFNDASAPNHTAGAHVVAAYRGGNPALTLSRDRIERISTTLSHELSIPFVTAIAELCPKVDGILILSVDPASRVREFEQAASCGKPVFLDKPLGGSLPDALRLSRIAARKHVAWFTASALRYSITTPPVSLQAAELWGPGDLGRPDQGYTLDLAWYGIHTLEAMYALLGPGVTQVSRTQHGDADTLHCIWQDGRTATVHLIRPDYSFGALLFQQGANQPERIDLKVSYPALLQQVVLFMKTGKPPVSSEETLEVFRLMQASQVSLRHHGALTALSYPTSQKDK